MVEQMGNAIRELQTRLAQVEDENGVLQQMINGMNGNGGKAKLEVPTKYGGDKEGLTGFVAQM